MPISLPLQQPTASCLLPSLLNREMYFHQPFHILHDCTAYFKLDHHSPYMEIYVTFDSEVGLAEKVIQAEVLQFLELGHPMKTGIYL